MKKKRLISAEILDYIESDVEQICLTFDIDVPTIQIKRVNKGKASIIKNSITIPLWATTKVKEFLTYYIAHELCHIILKEPKHNTVFKVLETSILADYSIKPIYARAYAKQLQYIDEFGQKGICNRVGKKIENKT